MQCSVICEMVITFVVHVCVSSVNIASEHVFLLSPPVVHHPGFLLPQIMAKFCQSHPQCWHHLGFLLCDAVLVQYMLSSCVCPFVCLSVCYKPALYQNG